MKFKKDDVIKLVGSSGDFRYGYVAKVSEEGWHLEVCMHEEGESKIEFDAAQGDAPVIWNGNLSPTERKLIPMLACSCATKEMAESLSISPITVRAHMRELRLKFHLDNRAQLDAYCQGVAKLLQKGKVFERASGPHQAEG